MGEFPSGQRGQTVNLLSMTSVVRIHLPPPKHLIFFEYQVFLQLFSDFWFYEKVCVLGFNPALFSLKMYISFGGKFIVKPTKSGLTHTVTHTAKCLKSDGEDDRLILSAALCFSAACSHDLCHEIAHLLGGAFLHLPRDVGVGAKGKSSVEVSEHTGYRFHVYAILQCQRRECVS